MNRCALIATFFVFAAVFIYSYCLLAEQNSTSNADVSESKRVEELKREREAKIKTKEKYERERESILKQEKSVLRELQNLDRDLKEKREELRQFEAELKSNAQKLQEIKNELENLLRSGDNRSFQSQR
ncbi:TPA: hypothetical protein EYP66_20660 [Candidatus Poribacteria bacterium]|nr:hypothetical protein [Candidatus Poribacteria bacterium]